MILNWNKACVIKSLLCPSARWYFEAAWGESQLTRPCKVTSMSLHFIFLRFPHVPFIDYLKGKDEHLSGLHADFPGRDSNPVPLNRSQMRCLLHHRLLCSISFARRRSMRIILHHVTVENFRADNGRVNIIILYYNVHIFEAMNHSKLWGKWNGEAKQHVV